MASSRTEVVVNIRNIAVGGAGVGEVVAQSGNSEELLGITAFVPYAGIGERVRARVVEQKERYLKTDLLAIEEPSPNRVVPGCKYFQNCGGCELQQIDYGAQLSAKFDMIVGTLRAAKFSSGVLEQVKPVAGFQPYNYRRRITLHIDSAGRVGFYRQNSRSVVPIDSCPISTRGINELLKNIQNFGSLVQGKISSIQLEEDPQGIVAVLQSPYDLNPAQAKVVLGMAKETFPNVSLVAGEKEIGGYGRQILELPLNEKNTLSLKVPAGSFSQVNWAINLKLINRVVEQANLVYGTPVYDLFSGAGNFSLPLARAGALVTAVECDKRLVVFGRENAKRANLDRRIEFVEKSTEKFLSSTNHTQVKTIVADPPRSGLGGMVAQFAFADRFLFVSCHLPSFVRDVKTFVESGWEVESIEPFDMFSQTSYVEILGVLSKSGS